MSWAKNHISRLQQGETIRFRPSGHSMTGKVNHRDLVEVKPIDPDTTLEVGAVVLCRVKGNDYLHLVKQVDHNGRFLIGNNHGRLNGWIAPTAVFGVLVQNLGKAPGQ